MLLFAASAFGSVLAQVGLSNIRNTDNSPDGGVTRRSQHASSPSGYHEPDEATSEQGGPVSGHETRDHGGDGDRNPGERGDGWRGGMPAGPGGAGSPSGSHGGNGGSHGDPGGAAGMSGGFGGGYGGGWQPGTEDPNIGTHADAEHKSGANGSPQGGKPEDETCGGCFAALPDDAGSRLTEDEAEPPVDDQPPPARLPECSGEICDFTPPGHDGPPKNLITDQPDCDQDCAPRPPGGQEAGRQGDPLAVPEPGSLLLMAPALLALRRKRRTG